MYLLLLEVENATVPLGVFLTLENARGSLHNFLKSQPGFKKFVNSLRFHKYINNFSELDKYSDDLTIITNDYFTALIGIDLILITDGIDLVETVSEYANWCLDKETNLEKIVNAIVYKKQFIPDLHLLANKYQINFDKFLKEILEETSFPIIPVVPETISHWSPLRNVSDCHC